jgi:lysozyme
LIKVIDVFDGTNITNWYDIKNSDVQGVMIKAIEGTTYKSKALKNQYIGAKLAGLLVGFYHFGKNGNVQAEYANFLSCIAGYKTDLRPCLDYECATIDLNFIKLFMELDSNLILYTTKSIAPLTKLPINKIWIANPTNICPSSTNGYYGVQYTWVGKIGGLKGDADMDVFDETIKDVPVNNVIMKIGENSQRVKLLQGILNVLIGNVTIDGVFGEGTQTALKIYQGLERIPLSGEIGLGDINVLLNDLKKNWFKFS